MYEFFGDAAHVHTGAADAPFGFMWGFFYVVEQDGVQAEFAGLEGEGHTAGATADYGDVILGVLRGLGEGLAALVQ